MHLRHRRGLAAALMAIVLAGCATVQKPVPLDPAKLPATAASGRIGIAVATMPEGDTLLPGASCLLCIAVASTANRILTAHAKSLPDAELKALQPELAERLRRSGYNVVEIAEPVKLSDLPRASGNAPDSAERDFTALRTRYSLDRLLLLNVTARGFERPYAAYVPTGDPVGVVLGQAYLVNLTTRAYEWYLPLDQRKASDPKWDEPPAFPGLTNAYFQAVESVRDAVLAPWTR